MDRHTFLFSVLLLLVPCADAHGLMEVPQLRGGAAKGPNNGYCPHCFGSTNLPMDTCGKPKYFTWTQGPVDSSLKAGEKFEIKIKITAHHMGHFMFRLCDKKIGSGMSIPEAETCLNKYVLKRTQPTQVHSDCRVNDHRGSCQPIDEANPGYWYLPPPGWEANPAAAPVQDGRSSSWDDSQYKMENGDADSNIDYNIKALELNSSSSSRALLNKRLDRDSMETAAMADYAFHYDIPADIKCDGGCTLQWRYQSANSCTPHPDAYACYFQKLEKLKWTVNTWCFGACKYAGTCPASQGGPILCGEEFTNCADVLVSGGVPSPPSVGPPVPATPPPPPPDVLPPAPPPPPPPPPPGSPSTGPKSGGCQNACLHCKDWCFQVPVAATVKCGWIQCGACKFCHATLLSLDTKVTSENSTSGEIELDEGPP